MLNGKKEGKMGTQKKRKEQTKKDSQEKNFPVFDIIKSEVDFSGFLSP